MGRTLGLLFGKAGFSFLAATKEVRWFWVPLRLLCNTGEVEQAVRPNLTIVHLVLFVPRFVVGN